jgi:hypothetical protein
MLAEATVVPRAVLDLGLRVDVQEGALLVAAFPCRKPDVICWSSAGNVPPNSKGVRLPGLVFWLGQVRPEPTGLRQSSHIHQQCREGQ